MGVHGTVTIVLGAGLVLALEQPPARSDERPLREAVRFANDTLSVRLADVPLADVLEELSRQSDAEIRGGLRNLRRVTASFEAVPLPQALAQLLPEQNFALVYEKGGSLVAIQLLGGTHPVAQAASAARKSMWAEAILDVLARYPPVSITGPLAEALGAESASLTQLLGLGLHNEDAGLRSAAVGAGLAAIQADPDLRDTIMRHLKDVDNASLTASLRTATPHAEDVARSLVDDVQLPEARVKATSILQRLRLRD